MKKIKILISIFLAAIWILMSEFVRNEFVLKQFWITHYIKLGLEFPSKPINGFVWGVWSLLFAIVIYIISKKFTFLNTILFSWFVGFILMWLVIWNLGVLPFEILLFAVPLSILEVSVALIIMKIRVFD